MSDIAIRAAGLSKQYRIGGPLASYQTFREALVQVASSPMRWLRGEHQPENTIWALENVSFEIKHGEAVGIIGRNGAGKSTLLKILSRITKPTKGRVDLYGRVGSLLEVGTGFHQELTGRENIFLNGAILGMTRREIERKFDEIVDFAEIERFLDTPVKHYSSGMYVRLAFAVAAHLEPEILLVDEVLAVGDAAFQRKCLGKMDDVTKAGRTVLFVSHQMDMIRSLCSRGLLLESGTIAKLGSVESVVDTYIHSNMLRQQKTKFEIDKRGNIDLQVVGGRLVDANGRETDTFDVFSNIILEFEYILSEPIEGAVVNFELKRNGSILLLSFDTDEEPNRLLERVPGHYLTRIHLPPALLKPGNYTISTNTGIVNVATFQHLEDILSFNVELQSRPSSFLSYAENRRGLIAVPLTWSTRRKTELS